MNKPEEFNEREELTPADAAFERELLAAMQRVDAPSRLSITLMNIAEAEQPRPVTPRSESRGFNFWRLPVPRLWMGGALAAALTVGVFAGEAIHVRRDHERAEAEKQFDEAQQITDRALAHARAQIQRAGVDLDGE